MKFNDAKILGQGETNSLGTYQQNIQLSFSFQAEDFHQIILNSRYQKYKSLLQVLRSNLDENVSSHSRPFNVKRKY